MKDTGMEYAGMKVFTDPALPPGEIRLMQPRLVVINGVPLGVALGLMQLRWWP